MSNAALQLTDGTYPMTVSADTKSGSRVKPDGETAVCWLRWGKYFEVSVNDAGLISHSNNFVGSDPNDTELIAANAALSGAPFDDDITRTNIQKVLDGLGRQ